ncbi:uncharacterized protein LOC133652927 isoform X3 [Entelurus aequoreus]|uniref:uncharacterized protein LOC133652927 isoform X3 n=1 Tax=Entelurus aequoreus TaxID=161455 RepID=UPI002B1DB2DA|nr:uncharacterized protein LOC133652927 isoform X3 [Entelurus aequoreus]
MASRLLDRLKRSLFKGDQGAGPEQEAAGGAAERGWSEDRWEAELEEEDECVTERLGGTLSFDSRGEAEDEAEGEGEGSGLDSDSDFLGESIEEGLSSTDASPVGPSPSGPLTRQLQDGWRSLRGLGGGSPAHKMHRQADSLSFEVTDASVVQDGASNSTPSTWSSRAAATRPRPSSLAAIPTSAGCTPPCAVATGTRWSAWSSRVRRCARTSRPRPSPSAAAPSNSTCLTCAPSLASGGRCACGSSSTWPTCRLDSCSSGWGGTRTPWVRCSTPRGFRTNWAGPSPAIPTVRPRLPRAPPTGCSRWWDSPVASRKWTSRRRPGTTWTAPCGSWPPPARRRVRTGHTHSCCRSYGPPCACPGRRGGTSGGGRSFCGRWRSSGRGLAISQASRSFWSNVTCRKTRRRSSRACARTCTPVTHVHAR